MKKCLLLLGFLVLVLVALPAASSETYKQCLLNCQPGVNECSKCCDKQFYDLAKPCRDACLETQRTCISAAIKPKCIPVRDECLRRAAEGHDRTTDRKACEDAFDRCVREATEPCNRAYNTCRDSAPCNPPIAGGCPGEVPPQKCEFTCQTWNPAGKKCIGPRSNSCPPKSAPKSKAPAKPSK